MLEYSRIDPVTYQVDSQVTLSWRLRGEVKDGDGITTSSLTRPRTNELTKASETN
jgi:hypothetical protein